MTIDPVTTEVVASRLRETASAMEYALYHSGYSPILRESKDGTAGITDAAGRVIMISGGLQYHFTAYQQTVQAVLARYPAENLRPGDSFVANDPYRCGSPHAPDFVALTPAFHGNVLIGFAVSLAHKSDIGGLVPGSSGAAAREIYHDGLLSASRPTRESRSRSRPLSPTTAASPRSCSAICGRRSAAPALGSADWRRFAMNTAAMSCLR
jgi:N-methylhydantoinase B